VLLTTASLALDRHVAELGRTLGDELLEPTRIYSLDCLALARDDAVGVHAMSHITGGGLAANLARVLPAHLAADVDRSTWSPQPVFELVGRLGGVARGELEQTFNQGIGMVAVVPADGAAAALELLAARGVPAWACGEVRERRDGERGDAEGKGGGGGAVTLVGDHPR
jgi:phosphoribosylformylglycinamidine cyclo-ligase